MTTINIGGVPEHFNLPWHLAIEDSAFAKAGINLSWQDVPEGTGRMCNLLRESELDVACILTDGIVKDIMAGNPAKIIQVYVDSPLLWGVHAPADLIEEDTAQFDNPTFAISRYGSGSHLMSFLLAARHKWNPEKLRFKLVNTIDGAVTALTNHEAQLFLWERYMTQPLVDNGTFKRMQTVATPWPSFVIAATDKCIADKQDALAKMLSIINNYTADFKEIPSIDRTIASHYDLQVGDVQQWLLRTEFSDKQLQEKTVNIINEQFLKVGISDKKVALKDLVFDLPKIDEEE
ncbi:substrate-binding domain-containing protein [Nonlabens ponticola]|uniref:ABC transporter substrate-binding protein n=1 Tax=Nonlabens ponticola TaxID=2496866 RepID=A0A3S9MZ30_9FLAO|nr:substrate-binding domain-containing protein [Nonlabens ponticola]AZQ44399.1 ABC transporter substrate-binding protein [Nonlabens ponticola]